MYLNKLILLAVLFLVWGSSSYGEGAEPGEEAISLLMSDDRLREYGIAPPDDPPPRGSESVGPFKRLVIKNANVIDGSGAPMRGPMNIVIEGDRIIELDGGGTGSSHVEGKNFGSEVKVIDAAGKYVLPGLINSHVHIGSPSHVFGGALTDPDYIFKLWLAHGITTVRDTGSTMGLQWTLEHKKRSEKGEIAAPRIVALSMFPETSESTRAARTWVRSVQKKGADGIKFLGASPRIIEAALDEAEELGMLTAYHHSQISVTGLNALDTARMGVDSVEHWYGLPEAMFEDRNIQDFPLDYNYSDEQDRFSEAGRLWMQTATPGSEKWRSTIDEMIQLDLTLDPTFAIYEANRDVMRGRLAEWHDEYAMPHLTRTFDPNPFAHGAFHFDWTTADEVAWRNNFRRWMTFVNDYKNAGGRVTVGSDSGFIYALYGFAYVRELELLQEAGFHPLEVVKAATINGAELLGLDDDIGTIEVGKKADLLIVDENPLKNFKVLYGTGHRFFDREATGLGLGKIERTKGVRYTVKNGIVYDAQQLLAEVREMVKARKQLEAKLYMQKMEVGKQ